MTIKHYFWTALQTLTAKGRRNGLKILTLAVGLSVGLVLASKVCYEQTYDRYISDIDRIYTVNQALELNGEYKLYGQTAGGVVPTMKEYFPQIEAATRFTWIGIGDDIVIVDSGKRVSTKEIVLADSCFFQIFDRAILAGNLTEALAVKQSVAISSDLAQKLCDSKTKDPQVAASQVIGKSFKVPSMSSSLEYTINGVYETFPLNSSYRPDVIISMPTIGMIMYDGSRNLIGNDRYRSFIKLSHNTSEQSFSELIPDYINQYFPVEQLKEAGYDYGLKLKPFAGHHNENESTRNMNIVLAIVAFALLLTSVLNYMLVVVSTSVTRAREMALRKCLGSESVDMYKMMTAESIVHGVLATTLATVIVFVLRNTVENLVGVAPEVLFTGKPLVLAISILVIIILLNSIIPAHLFEKIPIAVAFRNYRENRRVWKLCLLAVEFIAAAFLAVIVTVITLEYKKLTDTDLGFDTENLAMVNMEEVDKEHRNVLREKILSLADVDNACFAQCSPFAQQSGDNISIPGESRQLFNIRDFYYVDESYFATLGVDIIEGSGFDTSLHPDQQMVVDRSFTEKMKTIVGWEDVVGRDVNVTGHSQETMTICGVIDGIKTYGFASTDKYLNRPLGIFFADSKEYCYLFDYIFIRYHRLDEESLSHTQAIIDETVPGQNVPITPFSVLALDNFSETLHARDSILIGCIVTLLIALLGLLGYIIDEVKRRSKEIAVRRVNGAQFTQIRMMFQKDVMVIALPSVIVGCTLAGVLARIWLQQFSVQVPLHWWIFVLCATAILLMIAVVSDIYVQNIARDNPAESIKTE